MSGEVEVCGGEERASRPASGLWGLLWPWLRRDDGSSSDSLSSAGSDRTAVSFAFLAPPTTHPATSDLPTVPPPTDSYRKRVRDRNLQRQHDRDLTLHRKYGLYYGYDAFSLPPARRNHSKATEEEDRDRRATSESLPRRAAHVPGKRPAPQPPPARARPHSVALTSASLHRRHSRKRPAPQPPPIFADKSKENIPVNGADKLDVVIKMNSEPKSEQRPHSTSSMNPLSERKSEKQNTEEDKTKSVKIRNDKSFIKQIFENKKRNSATVSAPERILPSISELDKEAAEIISLCKLKPLEQNNNKSDIPQTETWFCTTCLKKYDSTIVTCQICQHKRLSNGFVNSKLKKDASKSYSTDTQTQTEKDSHLISASTSKNNPLGIDEKQKLKEMLKEMKDSLPKKTSHMKINENLSENTYAFNPAVKNISLETPTLRVGTHVLKEDVDLQPVTSQPNKKLNEDKVVTETGVGPQNVVITQHVVLVAPQTEHYSKTQEIAPPGQKSLANYKTDEQKTKGLANNSGNSSDGLNTPLKISSLLNPVYIPKSNVTKIEIQRNSKTEFSPAPASMATSSSVSSVKPSSSLAVSCAVTSVSSSVVKTTSTAPIAAAPSTVIPPSSPSVLTVTSLFLPTAISASVSAASSVSNVVSSSVAKPTNSHYPLASAMPAASSSIPKCSASAVVTVTASSVPPISSNLENPSAQKDMKIERKTECELEPIMKIVENSYPKNVEEKKLPVVDGKAQMNLNVQNSSSAIPSTSSNKTKIIQSNLVKFSVEQHSRRRELINQLEQSIAKGDERAAAEAASKLAQLRLSCSVLSFSSQIIADSSQAKIHQLEDKKINGVNNNNQEAETSRAEPQVKVNAAVQSTRLSPLKSQASNEIKSHDENKPSKSLASTSADIQKVPGKSNDVDKKPATAAVPSTSQHDTKETRNDDDALIQVWVEDREATRGPVRLRIPRRALLGELRRRAEASLGLAGALQRWIVGRALCTDDRTPLVTLAGPDLSAPFYLCVVQSETNNEATQKTEVPQANETKSDVYTELVELEQRAVITNAEPFECGVCLENIPAGGGVVLRECVHTFCRECLADVIRHFEDPVVGCPAISCPGILQEREIRGLTSRSEYSVWLARGLAAAERGARGAFHCRTPDCRGWALCEPPVTRFPCPVCKHTNCIPCQAIHEGETCEQHRIKLQKATTEQTDEGTEALLETLITKGEALKCPECSAIITKKWGCDWVKCSACKTEICWVTKGRRWGPAGKGDTSGGCRCGVDGKRCHPSCGYCH